MNFTKLAKLDSYRYKLIYGETKAGYWGRVAIRIFIESIMDSDVADIVTEVTASDNYIYLEGRYYMMTDYEIGEQEGQHHMDILVEEY